MVRYLKIDEELQKNRLNRVGIVGTTLFLQSVKSNFIEIWSVDSLFPSSWRQIFQIPFASIIYSVPACSYQSPHIFVFVAGVEKNEDDDVFVLVMFKLNYETKSIDKFYFSQSDCVPQNVDFPFETISLKCGDGENDLVMFDRSIVMGPIPFWTVHFKTDGIGADQFFVIQNDIADVDVEHHCSRFAIPFDAAKRIFGRLKDDSSMMIFCPKLEKWIEYEMVNNEHFQLPPTTVRGIRETYGRNGHRLGAVESPLTFHIEGSVCVARIVQQNRHFFYRIDLDHSTKRYHCSQRGNVVLNEGVSKMFYTLCNESLFAFIGLRTIAIVELQPTRLDEASMWKIQKVNRKIDKEDVWKLCKEIYEKIYLEK